jgi:hypothetical protein
MHRLFGAVLALHIAVGTIAIGGGLVALCTAKGQSRHIRAGRFYIWCMWGVIASAAGMTILRFNPYFAGLTASAAIAAISGSRVLRRKRPDIDPRQRATRLDWTTAVLVFFTGVGLAVAAQLGMIRENVVVVRATAYGATGFALWDIWRFSRPTGFPCSPNLWLYEHIVKILGAYFGAVAAFSGSVLTLLDPPWRQLWAVALGQALAVIFVVYYRRELAHGRGPRRRQATHVRAIALHGSLMSDHDTVDVD